MRARVTAVDNAREPAPVLALKNQGVGERTNRAWVKERAYPQESVGERTCESTGVGDRTILFQADFHHITAYQDYADWYAQIRHLGRRGKAWVIERIVRRYPARVAWKVAACGQSQSDQARRRAPGRESRFSRQRKSPKGV